MRGIDGETAGGWMQALARTSFALLLIGLSAQERLAAQAPGTAAMTVRPIANPPDKPKTSREPHHTMLWIASIAAMLAATGADAATSWHKPEANSLLASPNGTFGAKGIGLKTGIAVGVLLPQIYFRRHKDLRMPFTIGNLAEAAVFTGAAVHNRGIAGAVTGRPAQLATAASIRSAAY